MCIVQAKYFTKNTRAEWGNCNALPADQIRAETVVTFSGAELNKQYYCYIHVKHPNGTIYDYKTNTLTAYGTETFTTDIIPPSTGTFTVVSVDVYWVGGPQGPSNVCYG